MRKILKKTAILLAIYTAFAFIYIKIYGFEYKMNYVNGFSAFGIVAVFIGLLVIIVNWGGLDMFGYSFYYVGTSRRKREERKYQSYQDYIEKKKIERKPKELGFLAHFIAGGILLLVSTIIWII